MNVPNVPASGWTPTSAISTGLSSSECSQPQSNKNIDMIIKTDHLKNEHPEFRIFILP